MSQLQIKREKFAIGLLLLALYTVNPVLAQQKLAVKKGIASGEIVFENTTWKEVAAKAKKEGKYIFVDAYATWCAPCKLLKSTTFKDKKAAIYFNQNFVNYTADMEKGEGIALAEQWDITAYPALLFFNAEGKMVLKQVGYVGAAQLVEFGQQAMAKP